MNKDNIEFLAEILWNLVLPFLLGANAYLWTSDWNAAVVFVIIGIYFERVLLFVKNR